MKIENIFLDDYDKMNLFLEFFERIKEILFKRREISIREINFIKNIPETKNILPFTYCLEINQKQYLLIINDDPQAGITKEELIDYQNLFTNSKSQDGIIIVWNDNELSSIKLYKDEIYFPFQNILEIFQQKVQSLEHLIDDEISYRKRFLNVIDTQLEQIKKSKAPNLKEDFNSELSQSFEYFKSRPFREPKISIMHKIKKKEIDPIIYLFSDFISNKIDKEKFGKDYMKIIMGEDESLD